MTMEADNLDHAANLTLLMTQKTIDAIRAKAIINIHGDGFCLSCKAPVRPVFISGRYIVGRWCSVECRNAAELDE